MAAFAASAGQPGAVGGTGMDGGKVRPFVLVAEDDEDCARAISVILADDYDVTVCGCGRDVVACCEVEHPDLIIFDYQLPDMNGVRLVEALRRRADLAIPTVMMSAYSNRREASKRAGFDLFLQKPFGRAELLETVRTAIGQR